MAASRASGSTRRRRARSITGRVRGYQRGVRRDLAAVFGADVVDAHLLEVYHKAWINDVRTWDDGDRGAARRRGSSFRVGDVRLRAPTEWGVHFAGTETERVGTWTGGGRGERAAGVIEALAAKDEL